MMDVLIDGLSTLAAAFLGAWSAFALENRARQRRSVRDQLAAVNRVQFGLIRQYNTLVQLQKDFVDPVRTHPFRLAAMRPWLEISRSSLGGVDVEGILFLLETDDREWPFKVTIERQRFEAVIDAFNERSRCHLREFQPAFAASGLVSGGSYSPDQVRTAVGSVLFDTLHGLTEDLVRQVDQTVVSTQELIVKFRETMKVRFAGQRIVYALPDDLLDPELRR